MGNIFLQRAFCNRRLWRCVWTMSWLGFSRKQSLRQKWSGTALPGSTSPGQQEWGKWKRWTKVRKKWTMMHCHSDHCLLHPRQDLALLPQVSHLGHTICHLCGRKSCLAQYAEERKREEVNCWILSVFFLPLVKICPIGNWLSCTCRPLKKPPWR